MRNAESRESLVKSRIFCPPKKLLKNFVEHCQRVGHQFPFFSKPRRNSEFIIHNSEFEITLAKRE